MMGGYSNCFTYLIVSLRFQVHFVFEVRVFGVLLEALLFSHSKLLDFAL